MDVKSFYRGKKHVDEDNCSSVGEPDTVSALVNASCSQHSSSATQQHPRSYNRTLDPDTLWRVFPRQQMAFDFAKNCWQNAVVFAFEFGSEGKRKYLVTTYHHFSQHYLAMEPPRHFYEVITEGAVCRLYFDIEFKFTVNPSTPAVPALETFIQYVCYQLSVSFKLSCGRGQVLDLDSSNDTKFSRHLIFHLPNAVFTNNIHMGHWVHHICDQLRGLKRASEEGGELIGAWRTIFIPTSPPCPPAECLLKLFVSTERGETALLCDEGVYTRNRNFRLFLSSKLGKTTRLRLAQENVFKPERKRSVKRSKKSQLVSLFMDTLICNVSYETAPRILSFEGRTKLGRGRRLQSHPTTAAVVGAAAAGAGGDMLSETSSVEGYSSSPYPLLDAFITSCVDKGGVRGAIRRWSYFQQEKLVVYDIRHNRWCENIGRAHKSNNIMMIADLQRGVYYQKCHDPTCKSINFKSNEYVIPTDVNPLALRPSSGGGGQCVGGSGHVCSEWLGPGDISLEDLEDYSLDEMEISGSGGSGGSGGPIVLLDDETILNRIAEEMDFNFSDEPETGDVCSTVDRGDDHLQARQQHHGGSGARSEQEHSSLQSSPDKDLLFDRAYDVYESSVKRLCLS